MPFMWAQWLCRCAQTSAAVLLAGTAALRLLARGTGLECPASWTRLAWTSWGVFSGAAVLQLGLTAADMSGLPLAQACSGQVLGAVLGSTIFGAAWKARMGLLAAAAAIGWRPGATQQDGGRRRTGAILEAAAASLAAALLATLVWSGHAHASNRHVWLLPADLLHVVAAGAWPGGLLPLGLLLAQARREPRWLSAAAAVTRRFSRMSVGAVGVLTLSGLLNGIGLVGTLPALWPSVYGRLILCKVMLLAGMVGLGAVNRRLVRRGAAGEAGEAAQTLGSLWRNVAWESALAVCVLLATEALALSVPPASER